MLQDVLDALGTSIHQQDCRSPNGSSANRFPGVGLEGGKGLRPVRPPEVALDTWAVGGHA